MKEVNLTVEGMTCNHCVKTVEGSLLKIGATAKVNLNEKSVLINFDPDQTNLEKIKSVIEDQGFSVRQE